MATTYIGAFLKIPPTHIQNQMPNSKEGRWPWGLRLPQGKMTHSLPACDDPPLCLKISSIIFSQASIATLNKDGLSSFAHHLRNGTYPNCQFSSSCSKHSAKSAPMPGTDQSRIKSKPPNISSTKKNFATKCTSSIGLLNSKPHAITIEMISRFQHRFTSLSWNCDPTQ